MTSAYEAVRRESHPSTGVIRPPAGLWNLDLLEAAAPDPDAPKVSLIMSTRDRAQFLPP